MRKKCYVTVCLSNSSFIEEIFNIKNWKKCSTWFFCNFLNPLILERNFFLFFSVSHKRWSLITWNLIEYLHTEDFQRATTHLNIWTKILLFGFMYVCKKHTKISWQNWRGIFFSRFTLPHTLNPFYINLNGFNIHNIQHASGNRPLKQPALGSADKCTTFLPLAWSIKPDVGCNCTFHCFWT